MTLTDKVVLSAALCGPGDQSPSSDMAIADEAYRAYNCGATVVRLNLGDRLRYRSILRLIAERCPLLVELPVLTLGRWDEERADTLQELQPSLTALTTSIKDLPLILEACRTSNTTPSAYLAGVEDLPFLERFAESAGDTPFPVTMVLAQPVLTSIIPNLPASCPWLLAGHGEQAWALSLDALARGGHLQIGFERNALLTPSKPATSNGELVERATRLVQDVGREVADPNETRQILGLSR